MTFKRVVFFIVLIVIVAAFWYSYVNKVPATTLPAPVIGPVTPVVLSTAAYSCAEGKTITAQYTASSAMLALSDGRTFDLPQSTSADGTRYSNDTVSFVTKGSQAFLQENANTTFSDCLTGTTNTVNGISSFTDRGNTFTFAYPQEFILAGGEIGYTANWKTNTDNTLGMILATVRAPENYQPKTNLGEAVFSVGTSSDEKAVKECLIDNLSNGAQKSVVVINGVPFTKLVSGDAGAGNRYITTSYRAVQNSQCYAIDYMIHYAVIENFPASSGIKSFDSKKLTATLESIAHSFKFLPQ
jgi:membrane-bound inhibitor of C-type lysozyme